MDCSTNTAEISPRHGSYGREEPVAEVVAGAGGFEGGLSTRKYAAMTKVSRATAQREISLLLNLGLLVRRSGGGRSTSYDLALGE